MVTGAGTLTTGIVNVGGGSGSLVVKNGGTVTINSGSAEALRVVEGASVTIDNATLTTNGLVEVGQDGTASGSLLAVVNGGTLDVMAGTGTIVVGGTSDGTLQIGNGGTAGTVNATTVELGSAGSRVLFQHTGTTTFSPEIIGLGGVEVAGPGTTILTGANTYTGATNVLAGTLQAGGVNVFGNLSAATVAAGATLDLNNFNQTLGSLAGAGNVALGTATLTAGGNNATTTFAGTIAGTGGLTKTGTGTMVLAGANSYAGVTTIANGTLQIGNGGTTGTLGTGAVTNDATLAFNRSDTLVVGNAISGAGTVTQVGPGTTILTGTNTYAGGTTIAAGTLQIGNGGTTGSIIGDVVNNGVFAINRSDAYTFAGNVSGTGAFVQGGTGTTTLTGNNTYTGATQVLAGTLQAGATDVFGDLSATTVAAGATLDLNDFNQILGSLAGAGNVTLGTATLTTGGNDATTTFSGVIAGTGGLTKAGTGALILSGNNTYTGQTDVDAGTLIVNGSIATSSLTTVNAGALLGGSGIVGNTTINGGTLSPGNSIGMIVIHGNLVFTAASTYLVEIDPTSSDRTIVTGTATLGGAKVSAIYASGSYVTKRYTILSAGGGVIGTFATLVSTNLPSGFLASLAYDLNNVYLDLTLKFTPPSEPPGPSVPPSPSAPGFGSGLSTNQANVANALINSFNAAGGIPLVFGMLTPKGLTQVSGEAATGTQQTTFNAMDSFVGVMTDPFTRSGDGPHGGAMSYAETMAYAATRKRSAAEQDAYAKMALKAPLVAAPLAQRWSVWGAGYGGTQRTDGDVALGSNDVTSRIYGSAAGFDYRVTPDTFVGFALGGAGTSFSLAEGLGRGSSEMFQAGIYGRHNWGATYISGAFAYGWQDVITDRNVFGNLYRAHFDTDSVSGRIEVGHRFAFGVSGLTPYGAGQFSTLFLPDYAEQLVAGVNTFALGYDAKDVTAARGELGFRADTSFAMQDVIVTLRGRAAWAHNFTTDRDVGVFFMTLPASNFVVNGAQPADDFALVSAGGELKWRNGFSVAGTFDGEFSRVTESYAGKGVVRYQW